MLLRHLGVVLELLDVAPRAHHPGAPWQVLPYERQLETKAAQVDDSLRGRFNPLDALDPASDETIDEAGRIADAGVVIHESNDPFWDESARSMVKGLLLHVLTAPEYDGRRNLVTVRKLIQRGDWEAVEALRDAGETDIPPAHGLLWTALANNRAFDDLIAGIGDSFTNMLLKLLRDAKPQDIRQWWKQIEEWRAKDCLRYDRSSKIIKPQFVLEKLYEVTRGEAFVTSDVGQHQMWAAQFYKFDQPRRWINSGGLGTMGFGLPAAMGVQLANPGSTVACVTGESSIQMCLQELSTCKQYRLPIKIINLNNKYMGMVRQWQQFFHGNRYSESYMDALPDFVKLAEGYGHSGVLVDKPADVEPALREAFGRKNDLVFLDFITDQKENVYPMIPGGKGITEMILYEDL